ncbi:MAG: putative lipid II flippase FtsW, partial [Bdellovibrionota bacterium]
FFLIKKQLGFALAGFAFMAGFARLPWRYLEKYAYVGLALAVALLAATFVPGLGFRAGGAQRWIRLFGGSIGFQPAELAKVAVVIFVARQLANRQDRLQKFSAGVLANFLVPLPVFFLLLSQPDFGSVVILTLVIFSMMFLAGVRLSHLLLVAGGSGLIGAALVLGSAYRRARLATFLDPWSDPAGKGFQIIQSLLGFHNGKIWGVGLGNGKEKLFYLPEAHNDFIFAVIGEELGYLGVVAVCLAFLGLIYLGCRIGWNHAKANPDQSRFATYLAVGLTLLLGFQAFVNMAVVMGLLPTKGLNLPFISYGGSALFVDLISVGIILGVGRRMRPCDSKPRPA